MKTDDSELPETSNSAPVPTLSDIPLLPRRRLRDGTTSQSNSSRRGSRASTVGSSSSIASSRSSSSSSWRGSSSTKRDGSVKPRRGVQRLRGGGVGGAGGGSKETAVEVGDSDEDDDDDGDIIEVYASDLPKSSSSRKRRSKDIRKIAPAAESSSNQASKSSSSSKLPSTAHLPTSFQTYAQQWQTDEDNQRSQENRLWSLTNLFSPPSTPPGSSRGRYAMIILNQPITRDDVFRRAWAASRLKLCADGGANRLYDHLGEDERKIYLPDMIKGDLDSLRSDTRTYYEGLGVEVKQDPDQYSTDLMKCISEIEHVESESGSKEQIPILLIGGLSGRVDQTVHTMSLLHKLRKRRQEVYVLNGESVAWVLDEGSHLIDIDHETMGQTCGILPVGVESAIVTTKGLKWDLDGETSMDGLLSTSNHLLPEHPAVWLRTNKPILWCIEIKDSLPVLPAGV